MNRIKTFALAAVIAAGPLAATSASAQQYHGRDRGERHQANRDHDRNDRGRWNQRQHNGFYIGNRFYYGQPTYQQMQRRDYRAGYQQWRRGDRLPSYARQQYREVDWRRERLRQPPRGYHYVRDDRGEVLLVAIATGVILSILLNN
ncbi:MAG: RcnB family protein [Hyphomonadaceae bacterium]